MSQIKSGYVVGNGLYAAVRPISIITPPVISSPAAALWDPVDPSEYHITVAYNQKADVADSRIVDFLNANRITSDTVWRGACIGTPQWWENGGKVYLGVHLYSPELHLLHETIKSNLGVESSYGNYMCHLSFGRWRGIPPSLYSDRVFMNDFVKAYASASIPNIISTSLLEFSNAN